MAETAAGNVNESTDTGTSPLAPSNSDSSTPTLITCEKCAAIEDEEQKRQIENVVFSVSCPDGQVVNLFASTSDNDASCSNVCTHMILGRGKHGIPSSAVHVSRRSCVLRVVVVNTNKRNNAASHRLELVVLGSHPCRITRVPPLSTALLSLSSSSSSSSLQEENSLYIKSISQILNDNTNSGRDDMSPSSINIHHGDVIEPYARPMDVNVINAMTNGVYYPFTINITRVGDEKINGIAFARASRMINMTTMAPPPPSLMQNECEGSSQETIQFKAVVHETNNNLSTEVTTLNNVLTDNTATTLSDETSNNNKTDDEDEDMDKILHLVVSTEVKNDTTDGNICASTKLIENGLVINTDSSNEPQPEAAESTIPTSAANLSSSKENSRSDTSQDELSLDDTSLDDIDNAKDTIVDILRNVDCPGSFAVGGACENGVLLMPGLVVDGVGTIGLPLSGIQAIELSKRCEDAPFGRGSVTVVDKSVRNTFQLSPKNFKISNPSWAKDVENLTKKVCDGLGVISMKVQAQLYKLLLYEEGSFFAPHRDSEKVDGMFGTLVIVLPSQFAGGELIVNHKGEVKTFDQSSLSSFKTQYAAFYSDCKHEFTRVTSGHRLCLVYNLVKMESCRSLPKPKNIRAHVNRLKAAARKWEEEYDGNKIFINTSHKYTPAGIKNGSGSMKYKGGDSHLVELLESAIAEGAPIDYDHGTFSLTEEGYGEEDYDDYRGWRGGYGRSYTWGDTTDRNLTLTLSTWGLVEITDEEDDLLQEEEYFNDPEDETFEPTGNEGVNASRQYADVEAIVIWPRSQRWKVVTNNDTSKMCACIYKACEEGFPVSEPKHECIRKAEELIPRVKEKDMATLMKCIIKIGDDSLGKKLLFMYAEHRPLNIAKELLREFFDCVGIDAVYSILRASIDTSQFAADPTGVANLFIKYTDALSLPPSNTQQREELITTFVDSMSECISANKMPTKCIDLFPLEPILKLLICDKSEHYGLLAKSVLKGYTWMSSQRITITHTQYGSARTRVEEPKGPTILLGAASSLIGLCEKYGWSEFADEVIDAVNKLCLHKVDIALALVEKVIGFASSKEDTHRSIVCSRMASSVCERMLPDNLPSDSSHRGLFTLAACKRLFGVIQSHNPSAAPRFVAIVQTLDIDLVLYPLVTDSTVQKSINEQMKPSLCMLTTHCAQMLKSRLSAYVGGVNMWSVPHANLSKVGSYSSFLRNPCLQVHDWAVRKTDHKMFLQDLAPLVRVGDVRAESYQPGGRGAWHFKITKLRCSSVPMSSVGSMSCTCSSGQQQRYGYGQNRTNCQLSKHKATLLKCGEEKKKYDAVKLLLTAEQLFEIDGNVPDSDNRKRPAPSTTPLAHIAATPAVPNQDQLQQAVKKPKSSSEVIDLT